MADILRVTSAAVGSLLSASSSSAVSNQSFGSRVRVSGRKVKEISFTEVLRRSGDEGINLAEFLNNQTKRAGEPSYDTSYLDVSEHEPPLNTEHRTVSPSKVVLKGSIIEDESRHLIAPSTTSSEYISIIDVGQSLSTSGSSGRSAKDMSQKDSSTSNSKLDSAPHDIDLIPVRDGDTSSKKNTSSSTVSSIKTADVVDASTPNSTRQQEPRVGDAGASDPPSVNSVDRPKTPDLSDQPPALPSLNLPQRGLAQGSLAPVGKDQNKDKDTPEIEIRTLGSSQSVSARQLLHGSNAHAKRGAIAVQRVNPPSAPPATDQTSQIAAAVAAAVAATAPFHQLKAEIDKKIERLTVELQKRNVQEINTVNCSDSSGASAAPIGVDDSLDITLVPESDEHALGLPTPIHPRVAPKPHSHRNPRHQKQFKPSIKKASKQITADTLRSQFEESEEPTQQDILTTHLEQNQTREHAMVRDDVLKLLQEARDAKREILEIRHAERMLSMRSSVFRNEAPADIYLERIQERESQLYKPRFSASEREYRTPEYILQAKSTLYEIEEKRKSFEEKRYPLDSTYLCEDKEQSPENEEISKRISEMLDNIQKEIKATDPKKTKIIVEPTKPVKRKPKKSGKLEEKKALYAKLRADNQYQKIQANIGKLKQEEEALKRHREIPEKNYYRSPYHRSGLPMSYPLAPLPQSTAIAPSFVQHQSTPLHTAKHQTATQTSPLIVEAVDPNKYKRPTRDISVHNSFAVPEMIDQQCSPVKVPSQERAQSYSPPFDEDDYVHQLKRYNRNNPQYDSDQFVEVLDLPKSVTISGSKAVRPHPIDKYSSQLSSHKQACSKPQQPITTVRDDDKISVMQWLEDAILEKLLTETPDQTPIQNELLQILGEDAIHQISDLGLDLSPAQLHELVADIIKDQVDKRISSAVAVDKHTSSSKMVSPEHHNSQGDESKPTYDESFESSTSTTSKSSLSVALTPSLTEDSSRSLSRVTGSTQVSLRGSPVLTPPLSPEQISASHHSSPVVLPEGVPGADTRLEKVTTKQPAPFFDDTIEQIPLDLTDDNVSIREPVVTPDLTSQQHDPSLSQEAIATTRPVTHEAITPMNTATVLVQPADSLISQHPLDDTQQSMISQHPLEVTGLSENLEMFPITQEAVDVDTTSSTSVSYTETIDHPISAGEFLHGVVPRELAHQVHTGPLSEGEWPLSPGSADFLQLVKDPDIRGLLEQRMRATKSPTRSPGYAVRDDTIPETHDTPFKDDSISDPQPGPSTQVYRALPPAPRRVPMQTPSPLPKSQSADNFETLELVTPLPDTPEHFDSPSPPPFMGLQLEDYNYSGESVTKSDHTDSF